MPVRFDKDVLGSMPEPELLRHLTKYSNFTEEREGACNQIVAEVDRRRPIRIRIGPTPGAAQ